jgi:hypothetical protein
MAIPQHIRIRIIVTIGMAAVVGLLFHHSKSRRIWRDQICSVHSIPTAEQSARVVYGLPTVDFVDGLRNRFPNADVVVGGSIENSLSRHHVQVSVCPLCARGYAQWYSAQTNQQFESLSPAKAIELTGGSCADFEQAVGKVVSISGVWCNARRGFGLDGATHDTSVEFYIRTDFFPELLEVSYSTNLYDQKVRVTGVLKLQRWPTPLLNKRTPGMFESFYMMLQDATIERLDVER